MKYILSFSGGKDSCASVILAHLHHLPIDEIIFSEVMFDNNISAEFPDHINFIKNTCIPLFTDWGYKFTILHSKYTYMDSFNHIVSRSKVSSRNGKRNGFPMSGKCAINHLKVDPIRSYMKSLTSDFIQYVGIASDESFRLERLKPYQRSLLDEYNFTESMCFDLCQKYNLLSPIYFFSFRSGCWFCPNASDRQLKYLRKYYPDLWSKLLNLELNSSNCVGNIWNTLAKKSILEKEIQFKSEDLQFHISDYFEI